MRLLKSSFHILPSSGKKKNSKFQLHSFVRSTPSFDLPWISPWISQLLHISVLLLSLQQRPCIYSQVPPVPWTQLCLYIESPLLRILTSLVSNLPPQPPLSSSFQCTGNAFLSVGCQKRWQSLPLLPSGGNLRKCMSHFPWNHFSESQFLKLGILLSICFIYNWVIKDSVPSCSMPQI